MPRSQHEMICICDPDGHAAAESLRLEVQRRLAVRASELATAVCLSLAWQLGAEIEVFADMWFGVQVTLGNDGGSSEFVACDWPLDGLAFLWKWFADKYPSLFTVTGSDPLDSEVTRAISDSQLIQLRWADEACRTHAEVCSACTPDGAHPCTRARELSEQRHIKAFAIDDKWGMPRDAVAFYGMAL